MRVVILCGGRGTRMGTAGLPKALYPIGSKPILWHIITLYAQYGFHDFIACLGYKGTTIRAMVPKSKEMTLKFVDTGLATKTGGRIKKIAPLITEKMFFATYGDGLANINVKKLLEFHMSHKKIATITVVKPRSSFGVVEIDSHTRIITRFKEKPIVDHWINGGFFVFNREIFSYLKEGDILEEHTFGRLVQDKQVCAFRHHGFWKCMDTYKDNLELNELWEQGKAPWRVLQKSIR